MQDIFSVIELAPGRCCAECGTLFTPCRRNPGQKCCKEADCVLKRKRRRQRESYAKKRRDPTFRKKEAERVRLAMAVRRGVAKKLITLTPPQAAPSTVSQSQGQCMAELAFQTGLMAHLMDSDNLSEITARRHELQQRGFRLAAAAGGG